MELWNNTESNIVLRSGEQRVCSSSDLGSPSASSAASFSAWGMVFWTLEFRVVVDRTGCTQCPGAR